MAATSPTLLFRALVDVRDEGEAERVAKSVVAAVRAVAAVTKREVARSWWAEDLHEVVLELAPRADVDHCFGAVRALLGDGWRAKGAAALASEWTPEAGRRIVDRCIRWAGLEVAIAVDE